MKRSGHNLISRCHSENPRQASVTTIPVPDFEPAPSEYEAGLTTIRLWHLLWQQNITKSNSKGVARIMSPDPVYTEITNGIHKGRGTSWSAEQLLPSQNWSFSMELIEWIFRNLCQYYYGSFFRKGYGDRREHLGSMTARTWRCTATGPLCQWRRLLSFL